MTLTHNTPATAESTALRAHPAAATAFGAWAALLRPRVATMVFLTAWIGAFLGGGVAGVQAGSQDLGHYLLAALYITLVTGSASVLNQVIERDTDALMHRTRNRPLVTGQVGAFGAIVLGIVLGVVGTVGLALSFNLLSALLVLATLVAYLAIYTPMKRVSPLNTVFGAIPGAAPPLLGYVALAGEVGPWAWSLFATLFAWQFPHFMAIAWMYREDYRRGGHRMLASLPGSDGVAGRHAVLYGLALIPISLMPVLKGLAGPMYAIGALILGFVYLAPAVAFAFKEDRPRARVLLYVSLAYLPLLFALILLDPMVTAIGR